MLAAIFTDDLGTFGSYLHDFKFVGVIVQKVVIGNDGLIKIDFLCNMVGFVMEDHN